jgi:hypothetical protein
MYAVEHVARAAPTNLALSPFSDFFQSALGQIDILKAPQCFYEKICFELQTLLGMYAVEYIARAAPTSLVRFSLQASSIGPRVLLLF